MSHKANFSKDTLARQFDTGEHKYVPRGDSSSWDFTEAAAITRDGNWHDLDLSSIIPAGAIAVELRVEIKHSVADFAAQVRCNGNSNTINLIYFRNQVSNIYHDVYGKVAVDSDLKVEYNFANGMDKARIHVMGWFV